MTGPDESGAVELILASASPRRRSLLSAAGLRFRVDPSDADESLSEPLEPAAAAVELATRKAELVASRYAAVRAAPRRSWILGSDTVVALPAATGWRLLGKPADAAQACEMLRSLSDTTHEVVTGICVVSQPQGRSWTSVETTRVTMRPIDEAEVQAYVASGEWQDKAGGYAIQESADAFVTELAGGGFDNVVGLPVARTLELLTQAGAPLERLRSPGPAG